MLWIFCIKKRIDKVLIGEMGVTKLRFWEENLPLFQLISIRVPRHHCPSLWNLKKVPYSRAATIRHLLTIRQEKVVIFVTVIF